MRIDIFTTNCISILVSIELSKETSFPGLIDYNVTFPKPLGYGHFLRLFQAKHCAARARIALKSINFDAHHEINVSRDHNLADYYLRLFLSIFPGPKTGPEIFFLTAS